MVRPVNIWWNTISNLDIDQNVVLNPLVTLLTRSIFPEFSVSRRLLYTSNPNKNAPNKKTAIIFTGVLFYLIAICRDLSTLIDPTVRVSYVAAESKIVYLLTTMPLLSGKAKFPSDP